jgi:hypothetical protein
LPTSSDVPIVNPLILCAGLMLGGPVPQVPVDAPRVPRPFGVGERAEYDIRYLGVQVGSGSLAVAGVDTVRGHAAFRFRMTVGVTARLLVYKYVARDTMQSWVDTASFHSLRFHQDQHENDRLRTKRYEIFPDRRVYTDGGGAAQASVAEPLDDISFLYFVRMQPLAVGTPAVWDRHFKPSSNPVSLRVLQRETIEAAGRKWNTIVVQPTIKTSTTFDDDNTRLWISDDSSRVLVQLQTKLGPASITLRLKSYTAR